MEEYTNNNNHLSENTGPSPSPRPNFLYSSSSGGNHHHHHHHHHHQFPINTFHLQSGGSDHCFHESDQVAPHPSVKTEATTSQLHAPIFHYPLMRANLHNNNTMHHHHHQGGASPTSSTTEVEAIKAKIIAHPQYSNLLEAYMDCQKIGAPPEAVARMVAAKQEFEARQRSSVGSRETSKDPELDQFMEAYYDMLVKYREELTRPIQEAMDFMRRIETQLNMLCNGPVRIFSDRRGGKERDPDSGDDISSSTEP